MDKQLRSLWDSSDLSDVKLPEPGAISRKLGYSIDLSDMSEEKKFALSIFELVEIDHEESEAIKKFLLSKRRLLKGMELHLDCFLEYVRGGYIDRDTKKFYSYFKNFKPKNNGGTEGV